MERQIAVIRLVVLATIVPAKSLSDLPLDRRCRGERAKSGRRSLPRARLKVQHSQVLYFAAVLLEKLVKPHKFLENLILELIKTSLKVIESAPQTVNMILLPIKPSRQLFALFEKLLA